MAKTKSHLHTVAAIATTDQNGEPYSSIEIDGKTIEHVQNYEIVHYAHGLVVVELKFLARLATGATTR